MNNLLDTNIVTTVKSIKNTTGDVVAILTMLGAALTALFGFLIKIYNRFFKKTNEENDDEIGMLDISEDRFNNNMDHIKNLFADLRRSTNADKAYLSVIYSDNIDASEMSEMKLSIVHMECKPGVVNDMANWQGVRLSKFNGMVKDILIKIFGIIYRRPLDWSSVKKEYLQQIDDELVSMREDEVGNESEIESLLIIKLKDELPYQLKINPYMQTALDDQKCEIMFNLLITKLNVPSFIVGLDFFSKISLSEIERCRQEIKNAGYRIENEKWITPN